MPPNPRTAAINAMIRKVMAQPNIIFHLLANLRIGLISSNSRPISAGT
jgi:hypothetical protein